MNKIIIIILTVAALVRCVQLNSHMPALYGDEVSIAYNAYSVLTTGKDEFSRFLPLQFESWGDQKNPVYIYIVALFQIVFGLSEWSVRLPSAVAGTVAVYLTYQITKKVLKDTQQSDKIAVIAAALLAINPWHVHISRGGYEANLALTLGLMAVNSLLNFFNAQKKSQLVYAIIATTAAMYTYYTTKLFLPLILGVIWIYGITQATDRNKMKIEAVKFAIISVICSLPFVYLALFSSGQARFQSINIFANPSVENRVVVARNMLDETTIVKILENRYTYVFRDFLEYYLDNFSGQFLFVAGDSTLRYAIKDHGMFYLLELPFMVLGFLLLFKHNRRAWYLLVSWLVLAPLPTALVGRSYGLRSLAILPIPLIFSAVGIFAVAINMKGKIKTRVFVAGITLCYLVSASNWFLRYWIEYPVYGQYWYDSMQKTMIEYANKHESEYDNIILTRYYGKTEMYYAYYQKVMPVEYQRFSQKNVKIAGTTMIQSGKYYFGDLDSNAKTFDSLNLPPRTLLIADPKFAYSQETIKAEDDDRILFKVIKTN